MPPAPSVAGRPPSSQGGSDSEGATLSRSSRVSCACCALDRDVIAKEDPMEEGLSETSQVWEAYVKEASAEDANMTGGLNSDLDVLLIFAGLFSAVVTAFVIASYPLLQQNSDSISMPNNLVLDMVHSLREISGRNISSIPPLPDVPSIQLSSTPVSPRAAVQINGLWFASLTISLLAAFLAMLSKQWLHTYRANLPTSPFDQCLMRQHRRDNISRWRTYEIITMLPTLLHLSLVLFFAGLVKFLWPLHPSLAKAILAVVSLGMALYCVSILSPLVAPTCPYGTPLTSILNNYIRPVRIRLHRHWRKIFPTTKPQVPGHVGASDERWQSHPDDSEYAYERKYTRRHADKVRVEAIKWLLLNSRDQPSVRIAAQAIAWLPKEAMPRLLRFGALQIVLDKFTAYSVRMECLLQRSVKSRPTGFQNTIGCYSRAFVQLVDARRASLQPVLHWDSRLFLNLQTFIRTKGLDYATTCMAQCACLTYLMASETPLLEPDLESYLDSVLSPMTDRSSDGLVSPATARVIFCTLSICLRTKIRKLAPAEGKPSIIKVDEIVKRKAIPVLIESQHRTMFSNPLVRQMSDQWLTHTMLKGDEESARSEKQGNDEYTENLRLILSLWTIYASAERLCLSQRQTEITVWKLIHLLTLPGVDHSRLRESLRLHNAALSELVKYILAAKAPLSNEIVESATRIVEQGRSFMGYTFDDPQYIQLATKLLPQTLTQNTVDLLVANGGFLILAQNMRSPNVRLAETCTSLVLDVRQSLLDRLADQSIDWIGLETKNGLCDALVKLISSSYFTYGDLVDWADPLLKLIEKFEGSGTSQLRLGLARNSPAAAAYRLQQALRGAFARLGIGAEGQAPELHDLFVLVHRGVSSAPKSPAGPPLNQR